MIDHSLKAVTCDLYPSSLYPLYEKTDKVIESSRIDLEDVIDKMLDEITDYYLEELSQEFKRTLQLI